MRRGKDDFFLSLTLNDFVLTLLFLILLLSIGSLVKAQEANKKLGETCDIERVRKLEEEVSSIRKLLQTAGEDPKEVERLILVAVKDAQRLKDLEERLETCEDERAKSDRAGLDMTKKVNELEQQLAALNEKLADTTSGYQRCAEQMKDCGLGVPPCWTDAAGKVEYIYSVTIHEEGVSAAPRWSPARADDVRKIPGAEKLPGEHLALAEFGRRATPVLSWGKERNPECRHYVWIVDQAESKRSFKRNLLFIENFFYKYLERNEPQ